MNLLDFLQQLQQQPQSIEFTQSLQIIEQYYDFKPVAFKVGEQHNEAGQNQGSCKLLAFAQLHNLSLEHSLALFGHHYRQEVLEHPEGNDHQNIRQLQAKGWAGVTFSAPPLVAKNSKAD